MDLMERKLLHCWFPDFLKSDIIVQLRIDEEEEENEVEVVSTVVTVCAYLYL